MDLIEDNKLFRKLGLIKTISLNLNLTKEYFQKRLDQRIGTEINYFGGSDHNKRFHGELIPNGFKMSYPNKPLTTANYACVQAKFIKENDLVNVKGKVYIPIPTLILVCNEDALTRHF